MATDSRRVVKIALVGRYLSGKTALAMRLERDTFETRIPKTVAPDFFTEDVEVDDIELNLHIIGL